MYVLQSVVEAYQQPAVFTNFMTLSNSSYLDKKLLSCGQIDKVNTFSVNEHKLNEMFAISWRSTY